MQTTKTATWRGLDTATLLTALATIAGAAGPFLAALQGAT
jgi:hypothetical protein